jgi:hypothetical protein
MLKFRIILEKILPRLLYSLLYYVISTAIIIKNRLFSKYFWPGNGLCAKRETAYLFATGPSINKTNLDFAVNEDIFTVSNFVIHNIIDRTNPIAHFIAAFHAPLDMKSIKNWLEMIDIKLPVSTVIVTDKRNRIFFEGHHFKNRNVIYIETFPIRDYYISCPPYFSPRPWSVPQLAIPYIFALGYKEIVLCGCDHTALRDYGNDIIHFYSAQKELRIGASDKTAWKDGGIISQLHNNYELFNLYHVMQRYYNKKGLMLKRLTNDGWLDFIPVKE